MADAILAKPVNGAQLSAASAGRLRLWRLLALLLAAYVLGQDVMRLLRFSQLDPSAGTYAVSYARAPQFAPGFVEITRVWPGGPMAKEGLVPGDHIRFATDVRDDALPMVGETCDFTLDRAGVRTQLRVSAVAQAVGLFDPAQYTRSLLIALASLIAASFAAFIIWRSRGKPSTLLLGVSLAAYSLANSAPWIGIDSPQMRVLFNLLGRMIQTFSPIAFIAFALLFYSEFVGPVRAILWRLLAAYAGLLTLILALSEYLDSSITVWPLLSDGNTFYTLLRLAGSVAALVCVTIGWRRCHSATQQRYAILFGALFILVVSRMLYLAHFYLWLGNDRRYTAIETSLAISGTALAAPLFAYAILKQKVFDLGFVLNRTLVYGIFSGGLLVIFGLIEWGVEQVLPHDRIEASAVLSAAVALTIFLVFHRIWSFIEHTVERLFFRAWHENDAKLRRWVKQAAFVEKPEALAHSAVAALSRFAGGAECALFLRDGDHYLCSSGRVADVALGIDRDEPIAVALRASHQPLEPAGTGSFIATALALPISRGAELEGFFLLSAKPSGENYRPDEVTVLGWAADQIGMDLHALKVVQLEKSIAALQSRNDELQRLLLHKPDAQPSG